MEALKSCVNLSVLRSTLNDLPSGINNLYQSTLRRIEDQGESASDLARRTLLWLAHAKRPLRSFELQEALATSLETGTCDTLAMSPLDVILNVCCSLVVVNAANQEVSLIRECPPFHGGP